jgi:hypothetical protein
MMKAAIFVEPGRIVLGRQAGPGRRTARRPHARHDDDHLRDGSSHLEGRVPVKRGLTVGHEPVGVIEQLGAAVDRLM